MPRLHVTGASGAGVTTLGAALAAHYAIPHFDTDDFYWKPTEPPFAEKRAVAERLRLMQDMFLPRDAWVLSGSVSGWGGPVAERADAVVFVITDTALRLRRLRAREERRFGVESLAPGGSRERAFGEFRAWAASYDEPSFSGRSLRQHENWLEGLDAPVIRVDGSDPVARLVETVSARIPPGGARGGAVRSGGDRSSVT